MLGSRLRNDITSDHTDDTIREASHGGYVELIPSGLTAHLRRHAAEVIAKVYARAATADPKITLESL